ncbi:hypothetical protein [Miniphocaeibacter massiliensis]|uniref:hypothetical protein n=1 Tax=Miniphocaeibacter massiliensis TaxID=2041841 RepID=UPI000C1BB2B2|nr:hypothetical protein [Miniphocaeibacter massiliensis]
MKNLQIKQHNEVKKLIEKLSLSYKVQEVQSDLYIRKIKAIKVCKIIFTTFVIIGVTLSIFINSEILKILTAITSAIPLVLACMDNSADNYKLNTITSNDAESINELKERAISILYEITYNLNSAVNIQKEVDKLQIRKKKLYGTLIIPSKRAEKIAEKLIIQNIENEEEFLITKELREIKEEV